MSTKSQRIKELEAELESLTLKYSSLERKYIHISLIRSSGMDKLKAENEALKLDNDALKSAQRFEEWLTSGRDKGQSKCANGAFYPFISTSTLGGIADPRLVMVEDILKVVDDIDEAEQIKHDQDVINYFYYLRLGLTGMASGVKHSSLWAWNEIPDFPCGVRELKIGSIIEYRGRNYELKEGELVNKWVIMEESEVDDLLALNELWDDWVKPRTLAELREVDEGKIEAHYTFSRVKKEQGSEIIYRMKMYVLHINEDKSYWVRK